MPTLQTESRMADEDCTVTIALVDSQGTALSSAQVDAISAFTYSVATSPTATAEFSKTLDDGVTLDNSAITATVTITDTDTADLDGLYYHEAKYVDDGALLTVNMTGKILFRAGLI